MVTVYSGPDCQQCKMTARVLTEAGVAFTSVDISTDDQAREFVQSLGHRTVPVVVTPTENFSGFRPDRLRALAAA